jgi:hypothetical protein
MAAQMMKVEYTRDRKEVREVLTYAAAMALVNYLKKTFRIEARMEVAR